MLPVLAPDECAVKTTRRKKFSRFSALPADATAFLPADATAFRQKQKSPPKHGGLSSQLLF